MRSVPRWSRIRRAGIWLAAGAIAGAAWFAWQRPAGPDDTARSREIGRAVSVWAASRGLKADESRARDVVQSAGARHWLVLERAYWYPPSRGRTTLRREAERLAASLGLAVRVTLPSSDALNLDFTWPDGRACAAVRLVRQVFVAIVIDDLGYRLDTARRVVSLPCKLTCAIIPLTPHARACAAMASANGKEVYIHMPMQPIYQLPDVPEYRIVIKAGLSQAEVNARIARAFEDVPNAVGMNNHEGSTATTDRGLMDKVMAALKPHDCAFLDSGTIEGTVAYAAAHDAGLRLERRTVFLDADRGPGQIDRAFSLLLQLARRRGQAIGIGHHQFKATLDMLERRIPEAQRDGVEFVYASTLARR